MSTMFEKATRQKLRFASPNGNLSVEDVWDLPLKHRSRFDLDTLAIALNREVKAQEEESFVTKPKVANTTAKLKFDIVLHIIGVRQAEQETAEKRQKTRERNRRIMEIVEQKKDKELENKSIDELMALMEQEE